MKIALFFFKKKIATLLADKSEGVIIVGGDFNCTLDSKLDRLPATRQSQSKMSKGLSDMMKELGLVDIWRQLHPNERDFTYMSQVHGSYSRIDLFCISKTELHRIKESTLKPISISDHGPVTMKINLGIDNHFRYWRLNVSLLTDMNIRQELKEALTEYFTINDDGNVSLSVVWDASKATMRGKIISIGSRIKKQRLAKQHGLEAEIKKINKGTQTIWKERHS